MASAPLRFAVAADHAGFPLKARIIEALEARGHAVRDLGTHDTTPVDYPDVAEAAALAVINGEADRGVVLCGSGVGASVAANKVPGIRASVCHDTYSAHQGVEHDDMNVLCLGTRVVGAELAVELVAAFASAAFDGVERHARRLEKVRTLEARALRGTAGAGDPHAGKGASSMPEQIDALRREGQSPWVDYIRRSFITSGALERYVREGWVTGLTSNPTIFDKAISGSTDYDEALAGLAAGGTADAYDAFVALAAEDIRAAADLFRPVYEATGGTDGFASLEAPPGIEDDVERLSAEVRRLFALLDRPNVMIKIPATEAGVRALPGLLADGVNVNVTLLFNTHRYRAIAEAYLEGLERRLDAGASLADVASVASFFVSRVDTKVDAALSDESPLRGRAAIANARDAYGIFEEVFSGGRWQRLADAGARMQRPLWASTSTKDPAYPDVYYVEALVAPDTVNTMTESTLQAFADHGHAERGIDAASIAEARKTLVTLGTAGVDLERVTTALLDEGLAAFARDFEALLGTVREALAAAGSGPAPDSSSALGGIDAAVTRRLGAFAADDVVGRIWRCDHTLWGAPQAGRSLGWLDIESVMAQEAGRLDRFVGDVRGDGYDTAVLLGMGGSSLAPEVMADVLGDPASGLHLHVLSTTEPSTIAALADRLDLRRTLFIVASKSGTTVETIALFDFFWERIPDGRHFIAITDDGTPLHHTAQAREFRAVFVNPTDIQGRCEGPADIGGRYSALSYFGLVPAALAGVPLPSLLARAHEMHEATHASVAPPDNPGAWLGAVLGESALAGRDKLTFVLPETLAALGPWLEQLVAESTGKEGRGLLPVAGEPLGPPEVYDDDRLFVAIGPHDGLDALAAAGHPVVRLAYRDETQLGGEFFRWEFATAVAGHVLGINPFDQPNVQEAKDATSRILEGDHPEVSTLPLDDLLAGVRPGGYIALLSYAAPSAGADRALAAARVALRDRYHLATTTACGPSYLHSTGQLHKGGPEGGAFIVVPPAEDGAALPIPGRPYGFGDLLRAQALGDLASLRRHGRAVAQASMEEVAALAGASAP